MKPSRSTGAKKRADVLMSKIVRSRGACERCGSTSNLQAAHIVSRRFSVTRCIDNNLWCLCATCHLHLTEWPNEHVAFAYQTIGEETYAELRRLALSGAKVDWELVAAELADRWKGLAA